VLGDLPYRRIESAAAACECMAVHTSYGELDRLRLLGGTTPNTATCHGAHHLPAPRQVLFRAPRARRPARHAGIARRSRAPRRADAVGHGRRACPSWGVAAAGTANAAVRPTCASSATSLLAHISGRSCCSRPWSSYSKPALHGTLSIQSSVNTNDMKRCRPMLERLGGRIPTLTSCEEVALTQEFGFADGHAYHDLDDSQLAVVSALPNIWKQAARRRQADIERDFTSAFYTLAKQPSRAVDRRFRICTTASQSIDMVARFLSLRQFRVGLIEPTFDNLALILRRWKVPLASIAFGDLLDLDALAKVADGLDALFLVLPNNPTGESLSDEQFTAVVDYCRQEGKLLIIDFCFRFFASVASDLFVIMDSAGIDYICIEDTGKTWPTLDMKASLLVYSSLVANTLEDIYAEIFLCVSPFTLSVLTSFIQASEADDGLNALWSLVDSRHSRLKAALEGTCFRSLSSSSGVRLPMAWIDIGGSLVTDTDVVSILQQSAISCLPGRHFYWNSNGKNGRGRIRIAFLKSAPTFDVGMERIAEVLLRHFAVNTGEA